MQLKLRVEDNGKGMYIVHSEGSIDANTHLILRSELERILRSSPRLIIFDMKDVTYVSSAGIGEVLIVQKAMRQSDGDVLMLHVPPHIRKVFDIVQALPSQQIFASVEEMDRYLAEMQRKVRDGEVK